jgi:hypothetical protein
MVRPMRHDLGTVSARDWRAAREGEAHAASRTSESFIVGIGASGGLLAGAAIVFVTLLGIVSFNVWPSATGLSSTGPNVELTPPSGGRIGSGGTGTPLSAASGQLASASVPVTSPAGGGGGAAGGGGGNNQGGGSAGGSFGAGSPPPSGSTPATPPSSGGGSDEGPQPGTGEPIPGNDTKAPSGRDDDRSHKDLLPDLPNGNGNHGNDSGNHGNDNGSYGHGNHGNSGQSSDTPTPPLLGGSGGQSDDSLDSSDDSPATGGAGAARTDGIATTTLPQPPRPVEAPASGPDVAGATAAATGTRNR